VEFSRARRFIVIVIATDSATLPVRKARFGCQCTKAGDAQRCAAARWKHAIQKRKEEQTGDNLMNQRAKQHTISYETTSRTTHCRRGRDAATGLAHKCRHAMRPRSDATDSRMQAVNASRRRPRTDATRPRSDAMTRPRTDATRQLMQRRD
jgi:hypothetical protein